MMTKTLFDYLCSKIGIIDSSFASRVSNLMYLNLL